MKPGTWDVEKGTWRDVKRDVEGRERGRETWSCNKYYINLTFAGKDNIVYKYCLMQTNNIVFLNQTNYNL